SAAHISEIAHTSVTAVSHSAKRASALNGLCKGKCMRMWTDIFDDELLKAVDPSHCVESKRENNRWIDIDLSSLGNFAARLKQSVAEEAKHRGLNRKARRSLAKIDFVHMITRTPEGQRRLDNI